MNQADQEYFKLANLVLSKGRVKKNRTGIDTIGVFGAQARFNLQDGFPLLTTKKVFFRGIAHELLWFLSGSTNIKYLVDNDVHIWDEWAYKKYEDEMVKKKTFYLPKDAFIREINTSPRFAELYGELGQGTYGGMWREFPSHSDMVSEGKGEFWKQINVDQIQKLVDKLKNNPDDRRMIVSAWHPYWVDHCALPPCHCLFQFHTEELTTEERWKIGGKYGAMRGHLDSVMDELGVPKRRLNCQLYQRSCDLFLGVPFNIASYSLLTILLASVSNMVAGEFVHTYGDLHIYTNHLEQIKLQMSRKPLKLPTLVVNPEVKDIFKFKINDFKIEGYESHPAIKGEVAV